jgi:hypothetical protein
MSVAVDYPKVVDHLTDVIKELNQPCAAPAGSTAAAGAASAAAAEHGANAGVPPKRRPAAAVKVVVPAGPEKVRKFNAGDTVYFKPSSPYWGFQYVVTQVSGFDETFGWKYHVSQYPGSYRIACQSQLSNTMNPM